MLNRYKKVKQFINNEETYSEYFQQKNIPAIKQYSTYDFSNLKNINKSNLEFISHTVQPFEKIYMISQKYYSTPEYGWIICYMNGIKNELEIEIGQTLQIYFPIEEILRAV